MQEWMWKLKLEEPLKMINCIMNKKEIFFYKTFTELSTNTSNCRYWWKVFKKIEDELHLKNEWKREFTAFNGIMPFYEFHTKKKIVRINQYDPDDITENFDEREYITAYTQLFEVENSVKECLVIWLVMTKNNINKVLELTNYFFTESELFNKELNSIYSYHKKNEY